MNIVFMGTPVFAVVAFKQIVASGHNVIAVYTQPPKPAGRGKKQRQSPVHQAALEHGIDVYHPDSLKNDEAQAVLKQLAPDMLVVAAYGLILPKATLDMVPCYNIHASLLPKWRGAAPIQRAIMAGDTVTGISIMHMDEGVDTGDVLMQQEVPIDQTITAGQLHDELAIVGGELIVKAIKAYSQGEITKVAQSNMPEQPTHAAKLTKDEEKINWHQPAWQVNAHIRAFSPRPGVYFEYQGEHIKILLSDMIDDTTDSGYSPGQVIDDQLSIATTSGIIRPTMLQRSGKKAMPVDDFLRGFAIPSGCSLD